jgi:ribosomal protein S12 methylthiotransferase accessory factor
VDKRFLKKFCRGTHRLVTPEETLAHVGQFLPQMGITRIAHVTGLDRIGIPVVMVCRPNSKSLAVFQGKGLTLAAAKASGVMEAIEAYHGENVSRPLSLATYDELSRTHRVAEPSELPRLISSRFHPHLPMKWIEGFDLLQNEHVWIPYELVHVNFTEPDPQSAGCFVASSNGLASGNHLLEAISHGICEVIERDAMTLWSLMNQRQQFSRRVDLESVDDRDCRSVIDMFEAAGVDVGVWEMTTDVGVAAYFCTITERDDDPWHRLYTASGHGCHPSREIALVRALTEAAQSRLAAISGARDDLTRTVYKRQRDPEFLRQQRMSMHNHTASRNFAEAPSRIAETFDEDITWQLDRLRSSRIRRVIVIELMKPEFSIPVVRVCIPGLECAAMNSDSYALGKRGREFAERYG